MMATETFRPFSDFKFNFFRKIDITGPILDCGSQSHRAKQLGVIFVDLGKD